MKMRLLLGILIIFVALNIVQSQVEDEEDGGAPDPYDSYDDMMKGMGNMEAVAMVAMMAMVAMTITMDTVVVAAQVSLR